MKAHGWAIRFGDSAKCHFCGLQTREGVRGTLLVESGYYMWLKLNQVLNGIPPSPRAPRDYVGFTRDVVVHWHCAPMLRIVKDFTVGSIQVKEGETFLVDWDD